MLKIKDNKEFWSETCKFMADAPNGNIGIIFNKIR